jgi:hypothetical protein
MEQGCVHSAKALAPDVRRALESLLGRGLKDDETVSVRVCEANEGPTPEQRRSAVERLQSYYASLDQATADIPDAELDEIFDEAMRSVRPNYQSIR